MQLVRTSGFSPQTKQQFVYQTLREAIMKIELQPGQRLVIEDIAQQLGVSPIPVREALQLLQSERLVRNVPHVGAVVAGISRDSIVETFTVMEGLETVGTRAATERCTSQDLNLLRGLIDKMDATLEANDAEAWGEFNTQFHLTAARIAGMPLLQEMTERAFGQWDRIRRYYFRGVMLQRVGESQHQHKQIVEAMSNKDYGELEEIVKLHNQSALKAYTEYIGEHSDQPQP